MTYRILVTGTRNKLSPNQERAVRKALDDAVLERPGNEDFTVVHGACPTGVDAYVAQLYADSSPFGLDLEAHPADWYAHDQNCYHAPRAGGKCPAAGPRRNKLMVDLGADICLAFPMGDSKGTRGCIKLAQDARIPVVVTEL